MAMMQSMLKRQVEVEVEESQQWGRSRSTFVVALSILPLGRGDVTRLHRSPVLGPGISLFFLNFFENRIEYGKLNFEFNL